MFSFRSKTRQRGKFDAKVISNQNFHRSIVIPESVLWKVATKRKLSCIRQTLKTEIKHCICTLPSNFLEHLATIRQMQHFLRWCHYILTFIIIMIIIKQFINTHTNAVHLVPTGTSDSVSLLTLCALHMFR